VFSFITTLMLYSLDEQSDIDEKKIKSDTTSKAIENNNVLVSLSFSSIKQLGKVSSSIFLMINYLDILGYIFTMWVTIWCNYSF